MNHQRHHRGGRQPKQNPKRTRLSALGTLLAACLFATILSAARPSSAEMSFGALPTAEDFVTQQYEDFLGRSPDADGLAYWSDQLRAGADPGSLIESIARSREFEQVVAPIIRLYSAFFDRIPDYEGLNYWIGQVRSGVSIQQIANQFTLSSEFDRTYGNQDDNSYTELIYNNVLGRPADRTGLSYWVAQLRRGVDRGAVMVAFSDSAEFRKATEGRVLATMLYVGMLRRTPDPNGLEYWSQQIAGEASYRDVVAGFLGADEYRKRIDEIYHDRHPLTGVATRSTRAGPALAVKVDNVDAARPQLALDRADLIFEEMVEGRLTRLVAVYHSDIPNVVGPVRSVRTTDFHILEPLESPVLAASGANPGVLGLLANEPIIDATERERPRAYYRELSRRAPHNLFARPPLLHDSLTTSEGTSGAATVPSYFSYRPAGTPSPGEPGRSVTIEFGLADISFTWSDRLRGWQRTQNGSPHISNEGVPLAPANVAVLEVVYQPSSIDAESPEGTTVGSGPAWVFTEGKLIAGSWQRQNADQPIRLLDAAGETVELTPGSTLIELAPVGSVQIR